MHLKKRDLLLIVVLCFVLLAACSNGDGEAEAVRAQAGQITVYTTLGNKEVERYLAVFNAEYPNIKVNYVSGGTGIITDRLLEEADNPSADVVWSLASSSLLIAEWRDILKVYAPHGFERVNPRFRDTARTPHWVGIYAWMSAFCVNTDLVEQLDLPIPESWQELVDPVYKGHIVMANPNSSGTGFIAISAILQLYGDSEGWQYLDQLHQNIAQYTHSGSKPCQLAGTGDYPIGISFGQQALTQKKEGQPVAIIFPTEGSGWEIEGNALIKKDYIKPPAKTFLDWAISDSAMKEYAQDWAITTVKTEEPVPEGFPNPPEAQLIDNGFPRMAANRAQILAEWLERYDDKSEPY